MENNTVTNIRKRNQETILKELTYEKKLSRSELARRLNLSKPAVSDNVAPLIACGILEELGAGNSTQNGGRKPQLLQLNLCFRYFIAISLDDTTPFFILTNLLGDIIREFKISVDKDADSNAQAEILKQGIGLLIQSAGIENKDVAYIAISSSGAFDKDGNSFSHNPRFSGVNWWKLNLKQWLTSTLGIPTFVMNDTNAATLGQWETEFKNDVQDCLLLNCGIGLGVGLMLGGELFEGRNKLAGEIYGYVDRRFIESGITLEDHVCKFGLISRCKQAIENNEQTSLRKNAQGDLSFEDIVQAYLQQDSFVLNIVEDVCHELCVMIANFVNYIPVERVVFHGDYAVFGPTFKKCFEQNYAVRCHSEPFIFIASNSKHNNIHGVVARARSLLFEAVCSDMGTNNLYAIKQD